MTGDCRGEQLFTWEAAIRETAKVGKRMPTKDEWRDLKNKREMPICDKFSDPFIHFPYPGYRFPDGSFGSRGGFAIFWSSTGLCRQTIFQKLILG